MTASLQDCAAVEFWDADPSSFSTVVVNRACDLAEVAGQSWRSRQAQQTRQDHLQTRRSLLRLQSHQVWLDRNQQIQRRKGHHQREASYLVRLLNQIQQSHLLRQNLTFLDS